MTQKKVFFKKHKGFYKRHSIISSFILLSIVMVMVLTYIPLSEPESVSTNQFDSPLMTLETSNSKPLLVTHYATIINEYLAQTLPKNVSFTLVNGWVSKNTTIYYEGVSNRKDWVINGDFNSSLNPWDNLTTNVNILIMGWDAGGYVSVRVPGGTSVAENDYTYYFENISVPELFTPGKLVTFSMDYYYDGGPIAPSNVQAYMAAEIGGIEKNHTIYFNDLVRDSWTPMTLSYNPVTVGQELPDYLTLKVGMKGNHTGIASGNHELFIDNVEFKIWTQANQSDLIYAMDYETGLNYTYLNSSFGMGETFIGVQKSYNATQNIGFTIFNNITDALDIEIQNITITSQAEKIYNTTVDGVPGSIYQTNGLIKWQTEWDINIPFNYFNSWIEIEKPVDWNVTLILDGYDNDQTGQCPGTGFGSNRLNVPNTIIGEGLWILEAESYNYILDGFISVWNGTDFENETNLYVGDVFQITIVLNNTLSLTNTQINCTVQYPNDTLLIQESQEPSSATVTFGNYIVGLNMSLGTYPIIINWVNNLSVLERDKIGFIQLELNVIHTTNLTAVESYIEKVAGEPTLVKVKFEDFDLNTTISLAEVNFNTTYGAWGSMAYIGSGIYIAELDTTALAIGNYYLSFNASKKFYQNQSIANLVQLNIIPESLVLEVPRQAKNVMANSYAYFKINVTGEISGLFLSPANITITWPQNYTVSDFGNGTYGLNLSTFEITSGAIPETFTIPLTANKTDYGSTSDVLLLKVYPIPAQIGVNATVIQVPYGNQFSIMANYTVVATNQSISGATCDVTWTSSYSITPVGDDFLITFNTTGLSIDVHTALIQMSHLGYETKLKSIVVTITTIPTQIGINATFLTVSLGDSFYIRANYTVDGSSELIPGANCNVTWGVSYNITPIGNEFLIYFNTSGLTAGTHMAQIQMDYPGYETAFENVFVSITPIPAEIGANSTVVSVMLGDIFYIRVNYTVEGSNELISGANCTVTWAAMYNVTPIGDEFIIMFNTTGLTIDIYTALIQMSHPNYETALESVFVSISPIPAEIGVNATLVQITLNDIFYIKVNYTEEGTSNLIAGATCNVIWAASYNISAIGDEFLISFNSTSLSIDVYTILIQLGHPNYETEFKNIFVTIYPIPTEIGVNSTLVEVPLGYQFYIRVNYSEESTSNLIAGANCMVTWDSNFSITPIGNEFIITFNTTNLISDVYSAFIQMSHPNYETALKTILVSITPIPAQIGVNKTLVEVDFGDLFYIRVNYTDEATSNLIANATCTVSWGSIYNITPVGDEFIVTFNTTGLLIDVYTALIQLQHPAYQTALQVINVIVKPIESELLILNLAPIEFVKGDIVNLSCEYLANGQDILNATITLIGDISGNFQWNGSVYYFTINTTTLIPKSYFTQIMATKQNIELQIKDNIFTILQLNLEIQASNPTITYQEGADNYVYISILDISHNISRTDLTVTYTYDSQSGELILQPNGSYLLALNTLNLPPSTTPHQVDITVSNPYGDDVKFTLTIIVPPEEVDYSLIIYILVGVVVAVSGVLLGVFIKNRYLNLTKFQRTIRKLKTQLNKKRKLYEIKEPKRDILIQQLLDHEYLISKINHKIEKIKNV